MRSPSKPLLPRKAEKGEKIEVTGYRSSVDAALAEKREDRGIVDVIKAEDIGKFPDTNLAEALQRVSGVVIDRDAGEGRNITVRGLGPDFTRVRINGVEGLATTGGRTARVGTIVPADSTSTCSPPISSARSS
jgi:TonB-dependent receptor